MMAQINNKAVRSLSKLMEAGFDNEKAIMAMTVDDILALPNISVAEIGMINRIQKAVRANKVVAFLGGGDMGMGKTSGSHDKAEKDGGGYGKV